MFLSGIRLLRLQFTMDSFKFNCFLYKYNCHINNLWISPYIAAPIPVNQPCNL